MEHTIGPDDFATKEEWLEFHRKMMKVSDLSSDPGRKLTEEESSELASLQEACFEIGLRVFGPDDPNFGHDSIYRKEMLRGRHQLHEVAYVSTVRPRPKDQDRKTISERPPAPHHESTNNTYDDNQRFQEMMSIDSYQYSPQRVMETKPQVQSSNARIEDILLKFLEVQEESSAAIHAKLDSHKLEIEAKLAKLVRRVDKIEGSLEDVNSQIHYLKRDVMEQGSKITNLHYAMESMEDRLEWKIEALQNGFADPNEYGEWKCNEELRAYEELYLEEEADENTSREDDVQEADPVFYQEEDVEIKEDFGNMAIPWDAITESSKPQEEIKALANDSPNASQEEDKSLDFSNLCETFSHTLQDNKVDEGREGSTRSSQMVEEEEEIALQIEKGPDQPTDPRPHGEPSGMRPSDPVPHGEASSPRHPSVADQPFLDLEPHGRAPSVRSGSPLPHDQDSSMRPDTEPDPTIQDRRTEDVNDREPYDQAPSMRRDDPLPQGRTSSMRLHTSPTIEPDPYRMNEDERTGDATDPQPHAHVPSMRPSDPPPHDEPSGMRQNPTTIVPSDHDPQPGELIPGVTRPTIEGFNPVKPGHEEGMEDEEKSIAISSSDKDGEGTVIVYSCAATKFRPDETPGDEAFRQWQREYQDQGIPRPRNPPPSRIARRLQPVPTQTRFQHPYPRANVYQQNRFEGSQVSFRLPQQVFHDHDTGTTRQEVYKENPETLLAQHLEYVKLVEKTTRERLDRMDSILCERIDEISAFVKRFGEQYGRDAEELDKRLRRIESEIGEYFIGEQDYAGKLERSDQTIRTLGERFGQFNTDTIKRLTDVFNYIDALQRRAISNEGTFQRILTWQDRFEEIVLGKSPNNDENIAALLRMLRERRSKLAESGGSQGGVANRNEKKEEGESEPHVSCNVVNAHFDNPIPEPDSREHGRGPAHHREPDGLPHPRSQWISLRNLGDFNRAVADLPPGTPFAEACLQYDIDRFFLESCETRKEIRDLYEQASNYTRPFNTLRKQEPQGRFVVTCYIRGIEFKDALCDSGSCVNIISSEMARQIGIRELRPSGIRIGLANSTFTTPDGLIEDMYVRIGNCNVPTDFHVIETVDGIPSRLILGAPFLSTTGAVMDWTTGRMFFANINEDVFYEAKAPTRNRPRDYHRRRPPREEEEEDVLGQREPSNARREARSPLA